MNRHEIGNRLLNIRNEKGLSRAEVASKTDIGTTTLQQWETGSREASIETLAKLADLYKVSPQWLIFGTEGDQATTIYISQEPSIDDKYAYIPAYDIEASAGHGALTDGATQADKHLAFCCHWLRSKGFHAKDLAVIFTKGDSMTPTIPEGSAVVIDQSRTTPIDGKIFIIRIDDRLFAKRLQLLPTGLRLISDNKFYDPIDINPAEYADRFEICGQVVHASYDLAC